MSTASLEEALKQSLEERGILDELKSKIRAEVIKAINEDESVKKNKYTECVSREDFLIGEMFKEYLQFKGLTNTFDVFCMESKRPKELLERESLEANLNVSCGPNAASVPIIYAILSDLGTKFTFDLLKEKLNLE